MGGGAGGRGGEVLGGAGRRAGGGRDANGKLRGKGYCSS